MSEIAPIDELPGGLKSGLEAVLMVADSPVSTARLAQIFDLPIARIATTLEELATEYDGKDRPRGFELRRVASGWRFYTRTDYADFVSSYVLDGQTARLSQAALETLAVIAYRQPVSRGRISAIRGVNVDSVVRTLLTRGLITEHPEIGDGGATLYQTTEYFLERLGLSALEDLPALSPYLPGVADLESLDSATYDD
ncbi:SMC-Scp complex subunit ScpB [Glutamicibacter bergerei]|jgi:segregation and condensation protein B|uniref:SMC-Scp complex subunit ScpB n=2 Tax=Glutamicibacter TaxID=1742989 RepID=A0ABV9MSU7_9MICC|nr:MULTISPECIES: SMC-Scp complex subunit ScpB [Glutamicibacter]PCC31396.1 SMC-Scp complex subunit ScpB [Glutamicibacter sp. BW77]GGJ68988.1 segregation and condensation protein B [Glutamicibacter ardleyensis]HAY44224.1 SMC-Scp complex subunit ScpB [Micrococcaceae bacterium]HBV11459.1 SMC-Scp complex subunit ScpB [Micrococcaceae bacterium]